MDKSLSGTKTFLIGALSNAIATLITYPIQVVQAKMRVSCVKHEFKKINAISIKLLSTIFYICIYLFMILQHGVSMDKRDGVNGAASSKNVRPKSIGMVKTTIYLIRYQN